MPVLTVKTRREMDRFIMPPTAEEEERLDRALDGKIAFDGETMEQVSIENLKVIKEDKAVETASPFPGG